MWKVSVRSESLRNGGCAPNTDRQRGSGVLPCISSVGPSTGSLLPISSAPAAGSPRSSNHAAVLRACEAVVTRLATDRHYFARPERTLFCDIRNYFPMSAQAHVHQVVTRYVGYAQRVPRGAPARGLHGRQRRAAAVSRDDAQGRRLPARAARRTTATAPPTSTSRTPRTASWQPRKPRVGSRDAPGSRRRRHLHRRRAASATTRRCTPQRCPRRPPSSRAAVLAAVRLVLARAGARAQDVERFAHGMTVATNALLEGRTARTA